MAEYKSISPELLQKCQEEFAKAVKKSNKVSAVLKRINSGTAASADSGIFAREVGSILGKVLSENVKFSELPDGKLYWNIAQDVIKPMIEQNHGLVAEVSQKCLETAYKQSGIGIRVAKPALNKERVNGLLNDLCAEGITQEQLKERIESDVENITESFADDFIEENAEDADSVGIRTKVIRSSGPEGCCAWCESLCGEYDYDEVRDKGNDVWMRHTGCTCTIEFVTDKREIVKNYKSAGSKKEKSKIGQERESIRKKKKKSRVDSVFAYVET